MPEAVHQLKQLDDYNTPLEKVFCFYAVNNLITKAIANKLANQLTSGWLLLSQLYKLMNIHRLCNNNGRFNSPYCMGDH
jgi:hypothetical protein